MRSTSTCLGLHLGHDRAISIAEDGCITFHIAVERMDRKKHSESSNLPVTAIKRTLATLGIASSSIDAVGITYHQVDAPQVAQVLEAEFREAFDAFKGSFFSIDHHLAHALGAFSCSPFKESLVVVADGAGDARPWGIQAESLFHVTRKHFYLVEERLQSRPITDAHRPEFFVPQFLYPGDRDNQISLGLKYEQLTYLCGFLPGQAGQTMALAAFGEPLIDLSHLVPANYSFSLRYVDILREIASIANRRELSILQFARQARQDIAATAQRYLENSLTSLTSYVIRTYNPEALCFAGGVFLNCPANSAIAAANPNHPLFFMPVCNDEGQSIGAAAYAHWALTSELPTVASRFPYLGFVHAIEDYDIALERAVGPYEQLEDDGLVRRLGYLLANGSICGILRGPSEAGPRALGHRSILGDPRTLDTKRRLDQGVKRRAEFRPYAPMVLASRVSDYFESPIPSPYMLYTSKVKPQYRQALQAVVHVDGTARIQTVAPETQPFLASLLTRFEELSGMAVLLNTSFNDETEPIVDSPGDALRTFLATDLDTLVLGNRIYAKPRR